MLNVNEKSILVFFFLILIISSRSYSQQTEFFISDQKLDGIFNSQSDCIYNLKLDNSVLWEENYGIEFLLKKLDSQSYREEALAIYYLSNTKDDKFISVIAPYLNSSSGLVAMNAVQAISIIGTQKCLSILEEKLLSADKREAGLIYNLLNSLKLFTSESSLFYLESFIDQCDATNLREEIYLNKAKKIKEVILDYNFTIENQKKLIRKNLFSEDHENFNWAKSKIYQSEDIAYLPLLKEYINSSDKNANRRSIIILMQYLGEKDFEKEDLLILEDLARFNELKKARTLDILRQPLSTRSVKDF